MSNQRDSAPLFFFFQCDNHSLERNGVQSRERLIQKQEGAIEQERSAQGNAVALALAHVLTSILQHEVEAIAAKKESRQSHALDTFPEPLLAQPIGVSENEIIPQRAFEKIRVLLDEGAGPERKFRGQ